MSSLIIFFSKIIIWFLRTFKIGGGTAFPGLFVERYYPRLIEKITRQYEKVILITGTNGKTTTQQFLRHLLEFRGFEVMSNISGANLLRGIASSIISDVSIFGFPKSSIAVLEVEEATMPKLVRFVNPDYIIVTNLFRDQLDAYGEILQTRDYILEAIKKSKKAKLILNRDDPNVNSLGNKLKNEVRFFYIKDKRKQDIYYERKYYDNKRHHNAKRCYAKNVKLDKDLTSNFNLQFSRKTFKNISFPTPGLQNIYSALASFCPALEIVDFTESEVKNAAMSFKPAFGRGETVNLQNKQVKILLIKNPASFTANLQMLKRVPGLKLMILINDNIADGRDVSWLWDANLDYLAEADIAWITIGGSRAYDMRIRTKYAGLGNIHTETETGIQKALDLSLSKLSEGETLFVLPTYTAMLELRKCLGNIVSLKDFWKK